MRCCRQTIRACSLALPLLIVWAPVLGAQVPAHSSNKNQATRAPNKDAALTPLVQNILDLVSAVPPELSALADLRLVETDSISDRERRVELIDSAFSVARQSPYLIRKRFAYGDVDSRAGFLSYSYDLKLDRVSLQAEAVEDMLAIDPASARNLFAQMRPLKIEPLSCSAVEVYDPSAYYQAASAIFTRGFNSEEREQRLDADFLVSIFREVAHASEVRPAADLLLSLKADADTMARADGAFGRALTTISGDRRSFDQTQNALLLDLFQIAEHPALSQRALFSGARAYLVANYSGEACADSVAAPSHMRADGTITSSPNEPLPELDKLFAQYDVAPIHFSELVPSSHGDRAQNDTLYWKSQPAHQLETAARGLNGEGNNELSPEWQARAESFLTELRGWTDSSTEPSEGDFYLEKSSLYSHLLRRTPVQSPVFPDALNDFVAFLATPPQSDTVRIVWLSDLHFLKAQMKSSEARKVLEAALQRAPIPSIALWGYLDSLADARTRKQ